MFTQYIYLSILFTYLPSLKLKNAPKLIRNYSSPKKPFSRYFPSKKKFFFLLISSKQFFDGKKPNGGKFFPDTILPKFICCFFHFHFHINFLFFVYFSSIRKERKKKN